jgi:hypothetical protein
MMSDADKLQGHPARRGRGPAAGGAARAELARQTHTPVVVYRNGKVESQIPDDTARAGGAERREG